LVDAKRNFLKGNISLPADKSITHRAILFSALAEGRTVINASAIGRDNLASLRAITQLGASSKISCSGAFADIAREEQLNVDEKSGSSLDICIEIDSPGFSKLARPADDIYCGNSGTTSRLLTGILSGLPFESTVTGDKSLSTRPFQRVRTPLEEMGASFSADKLPLSIKGGNLEGIEFVSPRASAQVKSAVLLAGLSAKGKTVVTEPHLSRDHTERMLSAMGVGVSSEETEAGWKIGIEEGGIEKLKSLKEVRVPGDLSSAAFFMVAASLIPGSEIVIENCGLNPTRAGVVQILKMMGGDLEVFNERVEAGEKVADIGVKASVLKGVDIGAAEVVDAIDEIPIIAVAAAFAEGQTRIRGAAELRVKETDRLAAVANLLQAVNVSVAELSEGLDIEGIGVPSIGSLPSIFSSDSWKGSHDHRIEMVASVMDLVAGYSLQVSDRAAVETSFPTFEESFSLLAGS
jgi:3-phosphoshikimate 1-carboxyvinyltransferase